MVINQLKRIMTRTVPTGMAVIMVLFILSCDKAAAPVKKGKDNPAAPVEVLPIEQGAISLLRTFNGSLEAQAQFIVAPKVGGRIEHLAVKLADTVARGQEVATLDNDEYVQAVALARADLAVAKANLMEAKSSLEIAKREFERVQTLKKRGVASDSQLDNVMADLSAKKAGLDVASAHVTRAEALLETANIKLGYTKITADWSGGNDHRLVAERYVDEGHTVSANTSLLLIVELDPITGIIYITEKDYAKLQPGQTATLTTDAYPAETFEGRIERISPVFRQETRQARVELTIANPKFRLKPGMYIRVSVKLDHLAKATIVPEAALTSRHDQAGVFLVNEEKMTVAWHPVKVGIRQAGRVQVEGEGLVGRVVSLGHQLIDDGSAIKISQTNQDKKP